MKGIEVKKGKSQEIKYHRHPNGGGLVAETAFVDKEAYIGSEAEVSNEARVIGNVMIKDRVLICGKAIVDGSKNSVEIGGDTIIGGSWYINKSTAGGIHE